MYCSRVYFDDLSAFGDTGQRWKLMRRNGPPRFTTKSPRPKLIRMLEIGPSKPGSITPMLMARTPFLQSSFLSSACPVISFGILSDSFDTTLTVPPEGSVYSVPPDQ